MTRFINSSPPVLMLCLVALVLAGAVLGQLRSIGPVKDFKLPEFHPPVPGSKTNVLKTLLTGAEAQLQPGGQWMIKNLRIETYDSGGAPELVVTASECLFDMGTRWASGPGDLRVESADRRFLIEGKGFQWQQTNAYLILSNKVRTELRKDMVDLTPARP